MEWDFPCKVVIKLDDNPNNDRSQASLVFIDNHRRVEINAELGRENVKGQGRVGHPRSRTCTLMAFIVFSRDSWG